MGSFIRLRSFFRRTTRAFVDRTTTAISRVPPGTHFLTLVFVIPDKRLVFLSRSCIKEGDIKRMRRQFSGVCPKFGKAVLRYLPQRPCKYGCSLSRCPACPACPARSGCPSCPNVSRRVPYCPNLSRSCPAGCWDT